MRREGIAHFVYLSRGVYLRNQQLAFHKPLACVGILFLSACVAGATTRSTSRKTLSHHKSTAASAHKQSAHLALASTHKKAKKVKGQQVIASDRAREIQTALVREGYMKGEPSGAWDDATKEAMTRYQADHGWQTKTLPDSRALIQLGLGPTHKDAINAPAVSSNISTQAPPVRNSAVAEDRQ